MKDARGHGSDMRSGGLRGVTLGPDFRAPIGAMKMRPDRDFKNDAERTVYDLRQRMASAGPGHKTGLMQGIKNFLGG
jgi:hypothetical protein